MNAGRSELVLAGYFREGNAPVMRGLDTHVALGPRL